MLSLPKFKKDTVITRSMPDTNPPTKRVKSTNTQKMLACIYCGAFLKETFKFCPHCGEELDYDIEGFKKELINLCEKYNLYHNSDSNTGFIRLYKNEHKKIIKESVAL